MTYKDNKILTIEIKSEENNLGILFEKNLKFYTHITVTVKRDNRLVGLIKRTFYG